MKNCKSRIWLIFTTLLVSGSVLCISSPILAMLGLSRQQKQQQAQWKEGECEKKRETASKKQNFLGSTRTNVASNSQDKGKEKEKDETSSEFTDKIRSKIQGFSYDEPIYYLGNRSKIEDEFYEATAFILEGQVSASPYLDISPYYASYLDESERKTIRGQKKVITDDELEILKCCQKLTQLSLRYADITNDGIVKIANQLLHLDKLTVDECPKITEDFLHSIAELCPKLTHLVLWGCHNIRNIGAISNMHHLTELNLSNCTGLQGFLTPPKNLTKLNITLSTLSLKGLVSGVKLTELNLEDCPNISNDDLRSLPSTLTSLTLKRCRRITGEGIEAIVQQCPNLRFLNLTGANLNSTDLKPLNQHPSLESVQFPDGNRKDGELLKEHLQVLSVLSPEAAASFEKKAASFEKKGITVKDIDNTIIEAWAADLRELAICGPMIKKLKLSYNEENPVSNDNLQYISENFPNLIRFEIKTSTDLTLDSKKPKGSEGVTDDGLRCIVERCPKLSALNLMGTKITDQGLQNLSELENLTTLYLQECSNITGTGLQFLPQSIIRLGLKGTNFTDQGLQNLSERKNLTILYLRECTNITGNVLEYLPQSITNLDLSGCTKITDENLKHLFKLSNLMKLDLRKCEGVTASGIQELRWKIPQAVVFHETTKSRGTKSKGGTLRIKMPKFPRNRPGKDSSKDHSHKDSSIESTRLKDSSTLPKNPESLASVSM